MNNGEPWREYRSTDVQTNVAIERMAAVGFRKGAQA
jgi:hypothetical protein